jgi:hypothetical protein
MARRGLIAVLAGLVLLALVPATAGARPPIRALVYPGASSPVLAKLREDLGHKLRVRRATRARMRNRRRHRLLVLDGHALSPSELAKRGAAIDRYMDGGGWVLALDVRGGHFARTLDRLTRFSAASAGVERTSRAFLFRDAVVHGRPGVIMFDAQQLAPAGVQRLTAARQQTASARQVADVARLIRERLQRPATGVPAPQPGEQQEDNPYLMHRFWSYQVPKEVGLPGGYWSNKSPPGFPSAVLGVPQQGQQTAVWLMNHRWDVYLNNPAGNAAGAYQVITYNLNGEFSPKKPDEKFVFMYDKFSIQGIGDQDKNLERAWWTGEIDVSLTPDAATNDKLALQATAPKTPDSVTKYSSGDDFKIGFAISPEEGPGFEASQEVSNSQEYEIPDWGVENLSAASGGPLSWRFRARNNCDILAQAYDVHRCFDFSISQVGSPVLPNELSLSQIELNASARWNTKTLLSDPASGTLRFTPHAEVQLEDTYCPDFLVVVGCSDHIPGWMRVSAEPDPSPKTYEIYAADVVPVGIKSLDLSPQTVKGKEGATGTITLNEEARIPTTVVVFSDDSHAIVSAPKEGVSRLEVQIPTGKDSASFNILTNANRLSPGETATATISAFYGSSVTKQLKVTTP